MSVMNGYFRIIVKNDGPYVEIIPPAFGGARVDFDELKDYLSLRGYTFDQIKLCEAIAHDDKPQIVKMISGSKYAVPEAIRLMVSDDKMKVIARLYAPSDGASPIKKEEILSDLKSNRINYGIDEKLIDELLVDKKYCTDYIVARGTSPIEGSDGFIEYKFNTNPSCKPTLNDDGTVDFFNLNIISHCEVGQELAVLTKAKMGENGTNVYGETVKPRDIKKPVLRYGRNIAINDNETILTSMVAGNVSLVDDKVFVSDVYEVSDVDTSTGNIEYNGDVRILGNVKTGFCVQAEGSVEVRGVVEGAIVKAGKNVIINRGMNGMGRGVIIAGNNVVSKFIENANVAAGGYVHAEAILHSQVQAGTDVVVAGKKGYITGGIIRAKGSVEAKNIGSSMGGDTEIEIGSDPHIKKRAKAIQQSIVKNSSQIERIKPIIVTLSQKIQRGDKLSGEQIKYLKQLTEEYQRLTKQFTEDSNEYNSILDKVDEMDVQSVVKVSDTVYAGTKITISDVSTILKTPAVHSRFVKEGADIRIKAL